MCDNCVLSIIVGVATAAGATSWAVCSQLALESTLSPHSGWKGGVFFGKNAILLPHFKVFLWQKTQFLFLISRLFFVKHNFSKLIFQGDRSSQPSPSDDKSSQDVGAIDDSQIDPLDKLRLSQIKTDWRKKKKQVLIFLVQLWSHYKVHNALIMCLHCTAAKCTIHCIYTAYSILVY